MNEFNSPVPFGKEGRPVPGIPVAEVDVESKLASGRFGIRHLMIWMMAIALTSAVFRFLSGLESLFIAERGLGGVSLEAVFRAWFDAGLSAENARRSVGIGSILGLGLLVVSTRDRGQSFWSHPAKVLYGLMLALACLEFGQFLMYFLVGENIVYFDDGYLQLYGMGSQSTAFVWTFYVAIRSRCGWTWRLGLFLLALTCMAEVFFVGASMLATFRSPGVTVGLPAMVFVHLFSVACLSLLTAVVLQLSMIYEVSFGKHRDWRTWVTAAIPATILLLNWEVFYELYRYMKLNGFDLSIW